MDFHRPFRHDDGTSIGNGVLSDRDKSVRNRHRQNQRSSNRSHHSVITGYMESLGIRRPILNSNHRSAGEPRLECRSILSTFSPIFAGLTATGRLFLFRRILVGDSCNRRFPVMSLIASAAVA